ncbi:MAG: tetratricopeptide repeat protein [Acidobacteria bacterium]|nr:MAG: tetratricopeptide repeat protein [Acidobacteriota bacterium]
MDLHPIRIVICPCCAAAWPMRGDDPRPVTVGGDPPPPAAAALDRWQWEEAMDWEDAAAACETDLLLAGDYPGLVRLLEETVAARPDDDDARLRLGEAYVKSGRPQRALELLAPLHQRHPDGLDVQLVILDALIASGRHVDDFPWCRRMPVVSLDRAVADACAAYLARRGEPSPLAELYALGPPFGYLLFGPDELLAALAADRRFRVEPAADPGGPRLRLAAAEAGDGG